MAQQLTTVVEERSVPARLLLWDVRRLLASGYQKSHRLDTSDDVIRLAVPVRRTGLQQAVVDVTRRGDAGDDHLIRVFCKEGLVSREPTRRIADEVAQCLSGTAAAT